MKIQIASVFLTFFFFNITVVSALREVKLETEGRSISSSDRNNSYLQVERKITNLTVYDSVNILQEIVEDSKVTIVFWVMDIETEEYLSDVRLFNICDKKRKSLDEFIRKHVLETLGVEESECPLKPFSEPKRMVEKDTLTISLDIDDKPKKINLSWRLAVADNDHPLVIEKWDTPEESTEKP